MPEQPPTLRDMVQAALDAGQTYKQLEKRAIDPQTGQKASLALLNDIARGKLSRMPYDYHLRAIAAALQSPYDVVRRAAIAQWLPIEGEIDPEASRDELIDEARRLRTLADRTLDRLGDNGGQRGSA